MKISSNVAAAQDAVTGFGGIDLGRVAQPVSLASSTVSSMQDGTIVANKVMSCIGDLLAEVRGQSSRITALAAEIESRDKQDTQAWCEAR
jgi:hypothetical protein